MQPPFKVLIVGVGNMGFSHAKAYVGMDSCDVVGLVSREIQKYPQVIQYFKQVPTFADFYAAFKQTKPDIVVISTYPDTHSEFAIYAMENGAHVFVEKPLANNLADAKKVVDVARRFGRKLLVGYILQHHPSWEAFLQAGAALGRPLVIRLNLNQQSAGDAWRIHKNILASGLVPIVDCGVHYLDFMCRLLNQRPVRVHAMGAKLSDDCAVDNYGQLQVTFEDGSVGWYEAGWGPMMSECAGFVKDIIGPKGSVSMMPAPLTAEDTDTGTSADVQSHIRAERLRVHSSALTADGEFAHKDELINMDEEPDHDALCFREQSYLVDAIVNDVDLEPMWQSAIVSLEIAFAADKSAREGCVISLDSVDK
jgi:predicted dehydrogenase